MRQAEHQQVLSALREQLATAQAAAREGSGEVATLQRLMKEQAEAAREQRVGELMALAARRISQLALSRGWQAWVGQYEAVVRQRRLLRGVAGRLSKPKLTACFRHWLSDWETAERATEQARAAGQVAALRQAEHQQVLSALREQLATAQAAAREGSGEVATLQRLMKEQAEAAREQRVGELMALAARRISQLALSRGWQAWVGQYEAVVRQRRLLRGVAGRLSKPKLTACFVEWRRDWEVCMPPGSAVCGHHSMCGDVCGYCLPRLSSCSLQTGGATGGAAGS